MRDLVELVLLLNSQRIKASGWRSLLLEAGSRMEQLYDGIASGKISSDEDALRIIYQSDGIQGRLPSLKNKLKERLLDALFIIDYHQSGLTDRQTAYYECHKRWSAAMILLSRNAKITAIDLLETLMRHTVKFDFTELTLDIVRLLRLHYGTVEGNNRKYEHYRERYRYYQTVGAAENEAEELYADLVIQYVNSKSAKEQTHELAIEYYKKLELYLAISESFKLQLCARLIQLMIYTTVADYRKAAALSEDAIAFFNKKPYNSGVPLQVFYYQLLVCYLQLHEYDNGKQLFEQYKNIFSEEGSFNWFKFQELFFLFGMHTGNYEDALSVCIYVVDHPKLAEHPDHIIESWRIYEGYVQYLIHIGLLPKGELTGRMGKFKVTKFLNEIPTFSQDRRGMNIPVLALQILFTISSKEYQKAIDRVEAIEKYCGRYLRHNDTFRSNCFIKMLLQIPAGSFHKEAVVRKAEKYLNMLKSMPVEIANQSHEIEIIPYEVLWEIILHHLPAQHYKGNRKTT
jgi:tetratricopeptide (TPR) repeat protein